MFLKYHGPEDRRTIEAGDTPAGVPVVWEKELGHVAEVPDEAVEGITSRVPLVREAESDEIEHHKACVEARDLAMQNAELRAQRALDATQSQSDIPEVPAAGESGQDSTAPSEGDDDAGDEPEASGTDQDAADGATD